MDIKAEKSYFYNRLIENTEASEPIFDGCIIHVYKDTVSLPDGKPAPREVVHHNGAACVVPYTDDGKILCEYQYRYAARKVTLEIPAGKKDPGETPEECARRELEEETGYVAEKLVPIGEFLSTPGFCDEVIYMFAALGLKKSVSHPDDDEFLFLKAYPAEDIEDLILSGEITDGKTQAAVLKAQALRRLGKL